jgi:hypothetical protein
MYNEINEEKQDPIALISLYIVQATSILPYSHLFQNVLPVSLKLGFRWPTQTFFVASGSY